MPGPIGAAGHPGPKGEPGIGMVGAKGEPGKAGMPGNTFIDYRI